jgi:tetratricopeptide (TPR) repeat protein
MRGVRLAALLLPLCGAGCVYYNAMWSARRLAGEARRLEDRGRVAEAKATWLRASVKAESILVRHPQSRWADDALTLRAEALVRAGACGRARAALDAARDQVTETGLAERVALAAGECAIAASDPVTAMRVLEPVVNSSDGSRAHRARYLAGRASEQRGDLGGAVEWYRRSELPSARLARTRVLVELGRAREALDVIAEVEPSAVPMGDIHALLGDIARAAGQDTASLALDIVLRGGNIAAGDRARLLVADGERLSGAGRVDRARERYRSALGLAPDSPEESRARAGLLRLRMSEARDTAELRSIVLEVERWSGAGGTDPAQAITRLAQATLRHHETVASAFQTAEMARDSLRAPRLAGSLFLDLARSRPQSVFAPKALVAALAVGAEPRDSILALLDERYPGSAYTLALHGTATAEYAVLEDSLARALGLTMAATRPAGAVAAAPTPGPRGPWLDDVFRGAGPAERRASPAAPPPPARVRERPRAREVL